jgi:acyl carrier protein
MTERDPLLAALGTELARICGRAVVASREALLREDLGLDSLHLIQLAVWAHDRHGVNLGQLAAESGRTFRRVSDVLEALEGA